MTYTQTIDEDDQEIIDLLDEHDGLRIEDVADELEVEYMEARRLIHDLWDRCLIKSGPEFKFHPATGTPPKLSS